MKSSPFAHVPTARLDRQKHMLHSDEKELEKYLYIFSMDLFLRKKRMGDWISREWIRREMVNWKTFERRDLPDLCDIETRTMAAASSFNKQCPQSDWSANFWVAMPYGLALGVFPKNIT